MYVRRSLRFNRGNTREYAFDVAHKFSLCWNRSVVIPRIPTGSAVHKCPAGRVNNAVLMSSVNAHIVQEEENPNGIKAASQRGVDRASRGVLD